MTSADHRSSQLDLDAIQARATSEHLTPGPWKLDYEQCDCSDGYCQHGAYVAAVTAPTPTEIAAERLKGTDEKPRDYDFCRTEMGDFSSADWELMAHARTDVPALVDEVRRLRAALANEERQHGDTIDDRDHFHEMADKLAYAVAPEDVIGEHSSMNCPWDNALDLITPMAEVDKLRQELAGARAGALREAADIAESLRQFEPAFGARKPAQVSENVGILRVAEELRRKAGEADGANSTPDPRIPDHVMNEAQGPDDETFCSWGDGDAPGSGCILPAGHVPANRHLYTPGDGEFDE